MEVRQLLPNEAQSVIDLVKECYGNSYPYDLFYDHDLLQEKLFNGLLLSAVAIDEGEIVGHVGVLWESKDARTADAGSAIVRENYQHKGILKALVTKLGELYPKDLIGMQTYSVTTHSVSQRNGLANGTHESGFLIPEFPPTMNAQGVVNDPLGERNPALVMFCPTGTAPVRECYVPEDYAVIIERIYKNIGFHRHVHSKRSIVPSTSETQVEEYNDRRKGINKLTITQLGNNWNEKTAAFRKKVSPELGNLGWYIDIPVSSTHAIDLVMSLRQEGWSFGCLLFERGNGDYLRMQYTSAKINREALQLASDFAKELADFVFEDRARTQELTIS